MYERILQLLYICYNYNKHYNNKRLLIFVIGNKNTIIIHKQYIHNYKYMIKGFETNLNCSEVTDIIRKFYENIPSNPDVCYIDFKDFTDFLDNYKYYTDFSEII